MKAVIRGVLIAAVVATVPLSLWATYGSLLAVHGFLDLGAPRSSPDPPDPLSPPDLSARAGNGDVRLTWSVPSGQLPLVAQWEFEQSNPETVDGTYSTGSNATSYLVADLTNGMTYWYRVRAVLKAGTFGSWSNTVSATPMQVGDVLDRMERHQHGMARQQEEMAREQGRIADSASAVAAFMAENGEAFGQLADRGVDALEKLAASLPGRCVDCPGNNAAPSTHNIHHTTFAFRFAPPWFNADHRSLFTSYVVFPEEAKFEDWIDGDPAERCSQEPAPASVCPETTFYKKTMGPFLEGLSQCATNEKVQLHLVGFASATGLKKPLDDASAKKLLDRYKARRCEGKKVEDETGYSNMFNLLIANERAVNAAAMLEDLVPAELKNAFAIKAIPWCSHTDMANERDGEDGEGRGKGLMNRRVEVRLAVLPGCLNVDPDNRIDVTD